MPSHAGHPTSGNLSSAFNLFMKNPQKGKVTLFAAAHQRPYRFWPVWIRHPRLQRHAWWRISYSTVRRASKHSCRAFRYAGSSRRLWAI